MLPLFIGLCVIFALIYIFATLLAKSKQRDEALERAQTGKRVAEEAEKIKNSKIFGEIRTWFEENASYINLFSIEAGAIRFTGFEGQDKGTKTFVFSSKITHFQIDVLAWLCCTHITKMSNINIYKYDFSRESAGFGGESKLHDSNTWASVASPFKPRPSDPFQD